MRFCFLLRTCFWLQACFWRIWTLFFPYCGEGKHKTVMSTVGFKLPSWQSCSTVVVVQVPRVKYIFYLGAMTHKLARLLIPLAALLAPACGKRPASFQTLDFGTFNLQAPRGWNKLIKRGTDSCIGGLTDSKDTLWFKFGRHKGSQNL